METKKSKAKNVAFGVLLVIFLGVFENLADQKSFELRRGIVNLLWRVFFS